MTNRAAISYLEPMVENAYPVTNWMTLPEPPKGE